MVLRCEEREWNSFKYSCYGMCIAMFIDFTSTILGQGCNEDFQLNLAFLLQLPSNSTEGNNDILRKSLKYFLSHFKIGQVRLSKQTTFNFQERKEYEFSGECQSWI